MKYTDTQMIDFLEEQNKKKRYTGKCVFRLSFTGRGWRLHETSGYDAKSSVREVLSDAIDKQQDELSRGAK